MLDGGVLTVLPAGVVEARRDLEMTRSAADTLVR